MTNTEFRDTIKSLEVTTIQWVNTPLTIQIHPRFIERFLNYDKQRIEASRMSDLKASQESLS